MKKKYFDYCASAPVHPRVHEVFMKTTQEVFANPSSIHKMGEEASSLAEEARKGIADLLNVDSKEIVFTSGATESNNLVLFGVTKAAKKKEKGIHIITTPIEHSSIYSCCRFLENENIEVSYVPVDTKGVVDITCLMKLIKRETILISIMHVNNETGVIQPVEQISANIKKLRKDIYFHVDGVQGFGKVPLKLDNIDMYTLSGHKIGAPKGIGILMIKQHVQVDPIIYGGGQENGLRSGTLNLPCVMAMAEAIKIAKQNIEERISELNEMYVALFSAFSSIPSIVINSPMPAQAPAHIFNFSIPGIPSALTLKLLENYDIIASSQSACSSKGEKLSRVLMAITGNQEIASSSVRISIHEDMDKSNLEYLISTVLSIKDAFTSKRKLISIL
ncbi:cysteine desulfurase family protein [Paenibacillus donghaensis]|uniref:Aminotransferase class V domain-containing protein n=1 Tax=Paenibacillus donghaensis TaxID=414771 RepID=A0A2Z2KFD7_9BACL|nr:cysteine desulfurase family protein [Paenibacillus donghaensis]ASA19472.1 hypothetical protein B9T62_00550 [Paenibacillus donghaensis]